MASCESNGITIEYHEHGSGEPLLLVMGLGGQLIDWPQALIDALVDRGFRVITVDNRDSGLSTEVQGPAPTRRELVRAAVTHKAPFAPYTLDDLAADVVGVLDALGIESAHVAGMSMGGMVAQLIAINYPSRVRSLTSIMSTPGASIGRPKFKVLQRMARREIPTLEDAVEQSIEMFKLTSGPTFDHDEFRQIAQRSVDRSYRPVGAARQLAAILAAPDRTAGLRQLRIPALVIHGMVDPLIRPAGGYATARAIPGARLVMFNDMGHDLPRTRLAEMADEIASVAGLAHRQPVGV